MADAYRDELTRYLGPLEHRIMVDVWGNGPSTVNDVLERLNSGRGKPLVYNTVMTTLARLADKGHLRRHREGRAFVYEGDGPEEFLRAQAAESTRELVQELGDVAVAGIVDGLSASPETRELMRKMLEVD